MRPIVRYGLVGIANTLIGYGLILAGLFAGLNDYAANALGFAVGLCFSFFANRRFTFSRSGSATRGEAIRFLLCFVIAYSANLAVIALGRAGGHPQNPIVQLAGMAVYSISFFFLMRAFAFPNDRKLRDR